VETINTERATASHLLERLSSVFLYTAPSAPRNRNRSLASITLTHSLHSFLPYTYSLSIPNRID
jgi:hypothetical protein